MRYTIVGAGGIGGLLGAWMAQAGCDITFVDRWKEHVDAINEQGLRVDGARGEHHVRAPARTPDQLADLAPLDMVIVAVKTQDTRQALEQLLSHSTPETAFVSMQAGLNLPMFQDVVGTSRTIGANPHFGGALVDPGHLEAGFPDYIWIGELDGAFTPRLRQLHCDLNHWTPTYMTDNIWGVVWTKFSYGFQTICTALSDRPFGESMADPRHILLAGALVQEALALADALQINLVGLDFYDPDAYRRPESWTGSPSMYADGLVFWNNHARTRHEVFREHGYHRYVKTGSGMRWDISHRKRSSESTARLPALREAAKQAGLVIPAIEALMTMIQEIENGQRPVSDANLDELADIVQSVAEAELSSITE